MLNPWTTYFTDPKNLTSVVASICTVVGTVVGLIALCKGFVEYVKQGAQKRAESFLEMRRKYSEFNDVCQHLELTDNPDSAADIEGLSFAKKRAFIGFYEELALMTQSGLINWQVAHYMFGYYAIKCSDSKIFWEKKNGGLDSGDHYWQLFNAFVKRARTEEKHLKERPFRYTIYRL
jgi:hypothetical protein